MPIQFPQYIEQLKPYIAGKPIEETQREYGVKRVIKLASNENPLGPSPKAVLAMRQAMKELQLYPDASGFPLKWAENQLIIHHPVKARPIKVGQKLPQKRGDIGHIGDAVRFAIGQRVRRL